MAKGGGGVKVGSGGVSVLRSVRGGRLAEGE